MELYLSIDTETYEHIFSKKYLLDYKDLTINFILNPNTIDDSFIIFQRLVHFGFKKFNIIPVFATVKWDIQTFKKLKRFKDFLSQFSNL